MRQLQSYHCVALLSLWWRSGYIFNQLPSSLYYSPSSMNKTRTLLRAFSTLCYIKDACYTFEKYSVALPYNMYKARVSPKPDVPRLTMDYPGPARITNFYIRDSPRWFGAFSCWSLPQCLVLADEPQTVTELPRMSYVLSRSSLGPTMVYLRIALHCPGLTSGPSRRSYG